MRRSRLALVAFAALGAGCQLVLGIEERVLVDGAGGHGAGGSGHDAGGAGGGTGGAGGEAREPDGGPPCTPGASEACYDGPAGTEGVGLCKPGTHTCSDDGAGFGACGGEVLPSVEDCATPADEDCDGKTPPCTGDVLFAEDDGTAGDDQAFDVAVHAASGDLFVCGVAPGALASGVFSGTAFVERRDGASGAIAWMQAFTQGSTALLGLGSGASGELVAVGALRGQTSFGGAALASHGGLDALVAKLEPGSGAPVWAQAFGDAAFDQVAEGVAVDRQGAAFVVGRFEGALAIPPAATLTSKAMSGFLAKLEPDGKASWAVALAGSYLVRSLRVAVGASGDPVVVGSFAGAVTIGGKVHTSTRQSDFDGFVAAFDGATGAARWSLDFGGPETQSAASVALGADGAIVVGGSTAGAIAIGAGTIAPFGDGSLDGFVMKLDPKGGFVWGTRLGEADDQSVLGVAVDPLGAVLVTGEAKGTVALGALTADAGAGDAGDVLLAKLGAAGEPLWLKLLGDPAEQRGRAIAARPSDARVAVAGAFAGALDPVKLTSTGGLDAFVLLLAP